ncbi:MAG: heme ABC transporter ATP-binding protein [Bacteroidota bacterium]
MLTAKNITYQIGQKKLLNNISLNFQVGKINIIIGPNGAGKSSLIKLLSGQIRPNTGEILYNQQNIKKSSFADLAKYRAVLSQKIELAFPLNVSEVVMMGRYPHFHSVPTLSDKNICREAMQYFDILNFADRNYTTLSGGEKQRVHFARIASQIWKDDPYNTRYLFLDEPLTFLDIYYQFDFMDRLLEFTKNKNIVVVGVVHDLHLAAKYADFMVLLNDGEILASGTKLEVLTKGNIFKAFQLEPDILINNDKIVLHF